MFEQSILLDHATGKRAGALAASLTSQALLVGLLLLVPLIYHDRLPDARPWTPVILPRPLPPPPPEPVAAAVRSLSPRPSFPLRPAFHLPTALRESTGPVVLAQPEFDADALPLSEPAVPGSIVLSRKLVVPAPAPTVGIPVSPQKPHTVGGDVQAAKLIKKVVPGYPALARQARVSGTVRLTGVIARDGTVQRLEVESGHPLLVRAALEAVRQWVYRPTLLNGEAVEVIAPIDVIFTLSQ